MPDGERCGSPAVRGARFCFYHRTAKARRERLRTPRYDFRSASLDEGRRMALWIGRRLGSGTLPTDRAQALLSCLHLYRRVIEDERRDPGRSLIPKI